MLKKLFIMLLCPMMALPLVSYSIASTVSASAKPSSNGIVGEWMWGSSIADAGKDGAEKIMTRCAELGITDVYLLVKGTGGKLGYLKTKYTSSLSRTDRDILQEAIDAAHPKGIRIHAWICNMEDTAYKEAHNDAGMWHYIRARDNNKINLYDPGYLEYMTTVAKELAAYDIDGLHFDYIRYNHLANGWGENDFEALKRMGADIDRVKELIETTFGYHDKTASSNYIFNAYNNGDKDARLIAEYRRNNVKNYAMAVIAAAKAIKPNLIISAATMPEGAYSEAFAHLHYGQSYEDAALLYDYICPMGYSTNYGQSAAWPITLTENAIKMGNKVVMGLQAYEKATSDRLMSEIAGINYLRADKSYTDSALGVVFFRTGTLDYAKATYDNDKKIITVKMYNSAATSALSRVQIDVQDGIKITGASVGEGFENGTDIKFAKNGTYVRFTGKDILKGGKDGYLYLKYEGDINKESAPASVTASRTNTLIVYTATFSSNDEKADMGVPGDFTEPTVETTTDKVTTTEVTTLPDADETTALNNGNGQIANPETTASENKRNGCGSLISGGLTSVTAALAGIFAIKKKKKESKK
ncbi:MAG: family 10 glycosylhydrolase [Clostridia bacterium]|nr:family 10 glycosylhydrolase [Clostridia bacterium]